MRRPPRRGRRCSTVRPSARRCRLSTSTGGVAVADAADRAHEFAEVALNARLSVIDRAIPPGTPGECAACGEHMPRLVGGHCGFCRDGRRPPLTFYDRLGASA